MNPLLQILYIPVFLNSAVTAVEVCFVALDSDNDRLPDSTKRLQCSRIQENALITPPQHPRLTDVIESTLENVIDYQDARPVYLVEPLTASVNCVLSPTFYDLLSIERRFQPVQVPEPTVDETIQILRGLRERYEIHHKLRYTDESLVATAKLSYQYISDCFLPDKAIALIDEAGSRVRLRHAQLPEEARELEKELRQITKEKMKL